MATIYKFPLNIEATTEINMPVGAKILTVQAQFNDPMLWALVEPGLALKTRRFEIYGTGHEIPNDAKKREYINTFQVDDGNYVFHLFELI